MFGLVVSGCIPSERKIQAAAERLEKLVRPCVEMTSLLATFVSAVYVAQQGSRSFLFNLTSQQFCFWGLTKMRL